MTSSPSKFIVAKPGSVAFDVIAYLKAFHGATELTTAQLAAAVGRPSAGFANQLFAAVRVGYLRRRVDSARVAQWSIGHVERPDIPARQSDKLPPVERDEEAVQVTRSILSGASIFAYAQERGAAPFSAAISSDGRIVCERNGRVVCEFTRGEADILRRVATEGVRP